MHFVGAGGTLVVLASVSMAVSGCGDRGVRSAAIPRPGATPAASEMEALASTDLAAYERGRSREVTLMRAAFSRVDRAADSLARAAALAAANAAAAGAEREGAAAAGLPEASYRALVRRVDAALRRLPAAQADSVAGTTPDEWRRLDSLRVELTVLRSRLAATTGGDGGTR
jgi:hypothetical protein